MAKLLYTKYGHPYRVIGMKQVKNRDNEDVADCFYATVRIGGRLYRLEVSKSRKDGVPRWLSVTGLSVRRGYNGNYNNGYSWGNRRNGGSYYYRRSGWSKF